MFFRSEEDGGALKCFYFVDHQIRSGLRESNRNMEFANASALDRKSGAR
jgi:hypothetical protein